MSSLQQWSTQHPRASKLANNTYLERDPDGTLAVRLHATRVLAIAPDGAVTLDSGGWRTVTTRARMNAWLPDGWQVWQTGGIWYVGRRGGETFPYADGMVLHPDGTVDGAGEDPKAALRLHRQLRAFARDYMAAFWDGKVPAPSAGDCWGCCMVADDGRAPMGGESHIRDHLTERYYVPSMLARAVKRFPVSRAAEHCLAVAWNPDAAAQGFTLAAERDSAFARIGGDQLRKSLYRWLCEEVGQAG